MPGSIFVNIKIQFVDAAAVPAPLLELRQVRMAVETLMAGSGVGMAEAGPRGAFTGSTVSASLLPAPFAWVVEYALLGKVSRGCRK